MFVCRNCGYTSPKWFSQCPNCGAIGTAERVEKRKKGKSILPSLIPVKNVRDQKEERFSSGFLSLDRVLGGGLVKGAFVLIGGEPGIGKSTLMLQVASLVGRPVLYVSAEEALWQIAQRARRLGVGGEVKLLCETDWETVEGAVETEKPHLVIFDSLQTFRLSSLNSFPGSPAQVKAIADRIFYLSKKIGITSILVGHVTKGGVIAGPKLLEHMVDVVLYFEGEASRDFRILRAVKNRFGATDEIAVFEMVGGRLREVENPSGFFLSGDFSPGIAVYPAVEGKTPILLEVQSLIAPSSLPSNPRRFSLGVDPYRVGMLLGVMERYAKLSLASRDVYVNVSGGLKIRDPAVDLPLVLSLLSSYLGLPLPEGAFAFGEVSLTGRVLNPSQRLLRLKEAKKMGYTMAVVPPGDRIEGLKYLIINHISEIRGILK